MISAVKEPAALPNVPDAVIDRINRRETRRHKGKLVAIEPISGSYFIGRTLMEAYRKAHRRLPGAVFIFNRIGYRWAYGGRSFVPATQ